MERFMQPTLDAIDHRILSLLQEDASLNAAEVAERVGLSQSPCWRRIARLERSGLIRRRVAVLDRQKLGLGVIVFALIKVARGGKQTRQKIAAEFVGSHPVEGPRCQQALGHVERVAVRFQQQRPHQRGHQQGQQGQGRPQHHPSRKQGAHPAFELSHDATSDPPGRTTCPR
jgi:DNA-binding Lrp family transcriptional regulator